MTDTERLLSWFDAGRLVRPSAVAPNSVDLARALAALCGVSGVALDAGTRRLARLIGTSEHYVFVLVDGLGLNLIESRPAESFLRSHLALELQAVFPSSTAPALTSLATGLWPAEHGVPGWFTRLPEYGLTATILPFVERLSRTPLQELGVDPMNAFPRPALEPRYAYAVHHFRPGQIAQSVYTRYSSGGTPGSGYATLTEAVDAVIDRVLHAAGPTFTYVYYPGVDHAEHVHGVEAPEVVAAVGVVEAELSRLSEGLAGAARVVVSADHGQVSLPPSAKHLLDSEDPLLELLLAPPAGEPRAPTFHVRPGRTEEFVAAFRRRFGERFALLTTDEAERLRLFGPGPLSPVTRARIGDFMALSDGPDALLYLPDEDIGFHGGLLPAEMRIPLIVA